MAFNLLSLILFTPFRILRRLFMVLYLWANWRRSMTWTGVKNSRPEGGKLKLLATPFFSRGLTDWIVLNKYFFSMSTSISKSYRPFAIDLNSTFKIGISPAGKKLRSTLLATIIQLARGGLLFYLPPSFVFSLTALIISVLARSACLLYRKSRHFITLLRKIKSRASRVILITK